MFGKITFEKVAKATVIGGGVCFADVVAPLGIPAVVGITAVGAATSWLADSLGDIGKDEDKEKSDS